MKRISTSLAIGALALMAITTGVAAQESSYDVRMGIDLVQNSRYRDAWPYFNNELKRNPTSPEANYWMGYIHKQSALYGIAGDYYSYAIRYSNKKGPYYDLAIRGYADILLAIRMPQEALAIYDKSNERDAAWYACRSQIYMDSTVMDYGKALADIKTAMKKTKRGKDSSLSFLYTLEAACQQFAGNGDQALAAIQNAIDLSPDEKTTKLAKISLAIMNGKEGTGDLQELISLISDAVSDDNSEIDAVTALCDLRIFAARMPNEVLAEADKVENETLRGLLKEATFVEQRDNEQIVKLFGNMDGMKTDMSVPNAYANLGCYGKAIELYQARIEEREKDGDKATDDHFKLAKNYAKTGDLEAMESELEKIKESDPLYIAMYTWKAEYDLENGDYDSAIRLAQLAIDLSDARDAYAEVTMARALRLKGMTEEAKEHAKTAVSVETREIEDSSKPDLENLRPAIKKKPHFSIPALAILGEEAKCKAAIDEATVGNAEPSAWFVAAIAQATLRNADLALDYIQKALQSGYNNFTYIELAPELAEARKSERYESIMSKAREEFHQRVERVMQY